MCQCRGTRDNREVNGGVIVAREGIGAVDRKKKHRNGHDERNANVQRSGFYQASRAFGIMRRRGAFRELGAGDGTCCFAGDRACDVGNNPDRRSCSKQGNSGAGDGRFLKNDSKQNEEDQREGRCDDDGGESGDPQCACRKVSGNVQYDGACNHGKGKGEPRRCSVSVMSAGGRE